MNKKGRALVVFGEMSPADASNKGRYDAIVEVKDFVEPGSIYEATEFVENLAQLKMPNNTLLPKSFLYKGYELWWIHYNDLFYYFGLPFSQYKKLLHHVKDFESVDLYKPPFTPLFKHFLSAHRVRVRVLATSKPERVLPFGVVIQLLLTAVFLPMLAIIRPDVLVFAGDKFEPGKDFDFRMRFIYKALRERNVRFAECIRSLDSWKKVVSHAYTRKRPVMYSEAINFVAKFLSIFSGKFEPVVDKGGADTKTLDPEARFRLAIGTHYLRSVFSDVWAIRLSALIIKIIGFKAAYFSAALDRNYPFVLGCKLNNVPTAGILHGVSSRFYNGYDFLPGFTGEKSLSLDKYGVWSEWWKEYYVRYGKTYKPEQLVVSGPIRPLEKSDDKSAEKNVEKTDQKPAQKTGPIKVLFVSEQLAVPEEIMPYLEKLLEQENLEILFTFRQFGDGFKNWLTKNKPDVLNNPKIKIATGGLAQAIADSDIAVGSHSTAVLEMLLKEKMPLFFQTQKWGDYYSLKEYDNQKTFFAENPDEVIQKIQAVRTVSKETLLDLQRRYFGDPYQNGSAWLVDQLISFVQRRKS